MFTTPSKARDVRSSTPLAGGAGVGASHSTNRPSRAGTPVFGSHDPISPPSFLRRADEAAGDVSSSSLFISSNTARRTARACPRPSSMLTAPSTGPNISLLSPNTAFDHHREGSVISDTDARSIPGTVHSTTPYRRTAPLPPPSSKGAKPQQLEEGTVLLGDQWIHVSSYSRLPTEVTELLSEADLYIDAFQGQLDVATGYACLVSRTQVFVWNYTSRGAGTGSPTCFVFPVPEYTSSSMTSINDLSHACFLTRGGGSGSGREPALLLVAPDGQTCLWEGISSSLTRQDRAQRIRAPLGNGETLVKMERVDEGTVVLATSQSRLLRVSIGSRAGVLQAEIRAFSQPRGLLGRIFGSASAISSSNDQISSLAIAPSQPHKQGREVYAIGHKTLQKWHILESGSERLLAEQDIQQVIASSVLEQSDERYSAAQSLAFDILDGAVQGDGKLVLLFSQSRGSHEPLNYGLAVLDAVKDAGSFVIAALISIDFANYADPRPYAVPTLSMPRGGPAAFVTFADTVVIKQLEEGCEGFEEVVKLKDDVRNRFLGFGSDSVSVGAQNAIAALSLISAISGSLLVETNTSEVKIRCTAYTSAADRQRADTERLKGKLEQALYYSESPLNPLTLKLPAVLQGTLMTAAVQLSRELLTFSNPIAQSVAPSVDLRIALKDRTAKLTLLIRFIARCGHMEKLAQTTKRQLRSDAELSAALSELWVYQNEFYSQSQGQSALARAIEAVMQEQGLASGGEDVVRLFFRHHADLTPRVLERLWRQSKGVVAQELGGRSRGVVELNRVVIGAFRSALRYRKECGGWYGIVERDGGVFEGWTAQMTSVQLLESLFSVTSNVIPDRTRELGSSIDFTILASSGGGGNEEQRIQTELKSHLCSLAEIALSSYSERLSYLSSAAAASSGQGGGGGGGGGDSALERELSVFSTTYRSARPRFIHPLVSIGRSDQAFSLAEEYCDFRTLVELSTTANLYSAARLDSYLERYRESFAYELYNFYLESDQPKLLLSQKAEYSSLVLSYLDQTQNLRLGWLHDLALEKYDDASGKLESLAVGEEMLGQRKLMLSLSKLGFLSGCTVQDLTKEGTQRRIEVWDDWLDLVAVQESMVALWGNSIGSLPIDLPNAGTAAGEQLASEVTDTVATRLTEYSAYRRHYMHLVEKVLVQAKYLNSEDLVDLLTLKDTPPTQLEDFATAIKVLIRAQDVPAQRLNSSLRAVWRRAVIRDDWIALSETGGVSDEMVMADLKATALYAVLREVLGEEGNRAAYMDLQELVKDDGGEEGGERGLLEARFDEASDEFISNLMEDWQKERLTVRAFLDDSDLPRLVGELAAVAAVEGEGQEGEVTMRGMRGEVDGEGDGEDSMLIE
ncbi:hypothetical protein NDA14_005910 [Ustilago hordei]|nr:hypothetical protein NDA14_005910 [Ustilago hordei]UTT92175.1 hypothetical protein NDA17_000662 [Ustilago hordei]